jgi:hypothetical protein
MHNHYNPSKQSPDGICGWISPLSARHDTNPAPTEAATSPTISILTMVVWHHHDRAILYANIFYLSIEDIGMVMMATTSCEAWEIVVASFSLQSTVRTMQVHEAL